MNYLWKYIDEQKWKKETKYNVILFIVSTVFALIGFIIWLIIKNWVLSTWDWMVCFIVGTMILSWYYVIFYLYKE